MFYTTLTFTFRNTLRTEETSTVQNLQDLHLFGYSTKRRNVIFVLKATFGLRKI